MLARLRVIAQALKQELTVYRLIISDSHTPRLAKLLLGAAVAYALLPFDLIPDWIPLLGQLDDLIIVPLLIFLALKLIPTDIVVRCRQQAQFALQNNS